MKIPFRHRCLALICLVVVAVHTAVIGALPRWMPPSPGAATDENEWVFETRTLQEPAPRAPAPPRPRPLPQKLAPSAATPLPEAPATAPPPELGHPPNTPAPREDDTELAAASTAPSTATEDVPAAPHTVPKTTPPASVRLKYDVRGEIKGFPYFVNGDLTWLNEGGSYSAQLEISHFLLGSRMQTSKGLITDKGLEPVRFGDKVRSEVAAHFDRSKNLVTYSANTPSEALATGAQDQLSVFFQIAALMTAAPERFHPGSTLSFQTVGPKHSENWVFEVAATETLSLPGGQLSTVKITKAPVSEYDSRAEVWLAPELGYLPVRIRLTQGNGDVVDQLWRATERPRTAAP